MTHILQLDASARPGRAGTHEHGSHSRNLTHRFVSQWQSRRPGDPFTPLLADRPRHAVILSSRGGTGFEPGGELAHMNHLEPGLTTVLEFIGITNVHCIAIENQEEGGDALAASVAEAEQRVDALVARLQERLKVTARRTEKPGDTPLTAQSLLGST